MRSRSRPSLPTLYAIAGAPASGKTTFVRQAIQSSELPPIAFIHDCDAIMESMEGYKRDLEKLGPELAFKNWEILARKVAEEKLDEAINHRKEVIYDRSCALTSSYFFLRNLAKNKKYKIALYVLFVSEAEALKRAEARQKEKGRHIPSTIIRERIQMISALWPYYLSFVSEAYLIDNNRKESEVIASYEGEDLSILNFAAYEEFISQAGNQKVARALTGSAVHA